MTPVANVNALPYGPDTCKQGFVWRETIPSDHVCVTPQTRQTTWDENKLAASRRDPNGAYGANSCKQGYVWREAFGGDVVCVTPDRRAQAKSDNSQAAQRRASSPTSKPTPKPNKCKFWNGTANTGTVVADDPQRFRNPGGPYLGGRWKPCAKQVVLYFGTEQLITHYNLGVNGQQREIAGKNGAQQLVLPAAQFRKGSSSFTIQACKRGGIFERSTCTAWSRNVKIDVHKIRQN